MAFSKKTQWGLLILYMAIAGSYVGLEVDTFIGDLPFFQAHSFLLIFNVLFILLIPPFVYAVFASAPSLRKIRQNRAVRNGVLIFTTLYFHFMVLLALYKSIRRMDFDFYFFWYNATFAPTVLWKLYAPGLIIVAVSMTVFFFLQKQTFAPVARMLQRSSKTFGVILAALIISGILCQIMTIHSVRGSLAGFVWAGFLSDRRLRTEYGGFYENHLDKLQSGLPLDVAAANPSVMGDIVFFVVLESLNSHMVGDRITPQLMKASRDGIMFREFYANSIQSERSWEGILCGTPPGITRHLVEEYDADDIRKMPCLPGLFEKLGYRSMVFYGGTENPRAMKLFDALGFDDILTDEIMQPEDIKYDWGYREDIFFSRIDEYLQKHHADEKLFVFITNSATNHTPFEVLDEAYLDDVPFPDPQLFEERLSNTTYIQDDYFGHFYNLYRNNYSHRSSLFVMSDHAWPVPIHEQNIYNERGAYEENFLISLLYVPPAIQNAHFAGPSDVPLRYSQMDILPTIFDLIGLQTTFHLGESFAPWLLASPAEKLPDAVKPKISVQPYGGGFISVVRYPRKYLFDILAGNLVVFDLENDPQERSPSKRNISQYMHLIHDFFGHKKAGPR